MPGGYRLREDRLLAFLEEVKADRERAVASQPTPLTPTKAHVSKVRAELIAAGLI
jgi:hypothetical protein